MAKRKPAPRKPKPAPAPEPLPEPPEEKQPSGAAKMRASGKRGILLSVTPEEYERFKSAARADRRSLSGWVVNAAIQQLRFVVEENTSE